MREKCYKIIPQMMKYLYNETERSRNMKQPEWNRLMHKYYAGYNKKYSEFKIYMKNQLDEIEFISVIIFLRDLHDLVVGVFDTAGWMSDDIYFYVKITWKITKHKCSSISIEGNTTFHSVYVDGYVFIIPLQDFMSSDISYNNDGKTSYIFEEAHGCNFSIERPHKVLMSIKRCKWRFWNVHSFLQLLHRIIDSWY